MTVRFTVCDETIEVKDAEAANALRRALDKARADEREACAKVAITHARKKSSIAAAREADGDVESAREADAEARTASFLAVLITARSDAAGAVAPTATPRTHVLFYDGPPKLGDLNFSNRVFGRYANGASAIEGSSRAIRFGTRGHFLAASRAWLTRTKQT